MRYSIPEKVSYVTETLEKAGFDAYLVGGCVRDLIISREPKDWDVTTNAQPEQIVSLFHKAVYENNFGTVGVIHETEPLDSPVRNIEVTTYRSETTYSDRRHPDAIEFAQTLEEDLKRRDFTMNAMAYQVSQETLIDPFDGRKDLDQQLIQAVGNPVKRFSEDALRIMRAVRFAAELGFTIESNTQDAIAQFSANLKYVSPERIREEFVKMIQSNQPKQGIMLCHELGILPFVSPELEGCFGIDQNKSHVFDVGTHLVNSLQHAADREFPLHVRLAALFHDIGKPATRRFDKAAGDYTFYGHEVVGAKITKRTLHELKFDKKTIEKVTKLVRYHMFFSDPDEITLSAVRRMIVNVGKDLIWDLIHVRYSDRIGMGRPKEAPYRLRKYESMIEEALRDPVSVKMLKLNGDVMINEMDFKPGPRMGWILHALLEHVLDDPSKNTQDYLEHWARELDRLPDEELQAMGEAGKSKRDELEEAEVAQLRKKHKVN
jgi:tRNA nucleotidyltransferase (CCA-adding enzyme)